MGKVSPRKKSAYEYHRSSSNPYKIEFYVWFGFCKQISVDLLNKQMMSFDQNVLSFFNRTKLDPETNELYPLPHLLFLPKSPYFPVVSAIQINAAKSENLNTV
jgi:hypothetical protein